MILIVREWYSARTMREQRLLLAMVAIMLPLLAWLLVVRPLNAAYDEAIDQQLMAADRHGRIVALVEVAKASPARPRLVNDADLQLVSMEAAIQSGLSLEEATPAGTDAITVTIAGAPAPAIAQWLRDLEARGIRVAQLRMNPTGSGLTTFSGRLVRS